MAVVPFLERKFSASNVVLLFLVSLLWLRRRGFLLYIFLGLGRTPDDDSYNLLLWCPHLAKTPCGCPLPVPRGEGIQIIALRREKSQVLQ